MTESSARDQLPKMAAGPWQTAAALVATVFVAACSAPPHPGELTTPDASTFADAFTYVPPEAEAHVDAAGPSPETDGATDAPEEAGGLAMVSITAGDGGAVTAISFGQGGLVHCGSAANPVPVLIGNIGSVPVTWSAAVSAGMMSYSLSAMSGTVSPGEVGTLQIAPNPIPSTSPVTPDLYGGIVTITTNAANDGTHIIQLHQTAQGAIVNSTLTDKYDFGAQFVQQTATAQFSLTNTGNLPTEVTLTTGSTAFGVSAPTGTILPFNLGAGATAAPQITFKPIATQSYTDTLVLSLVSPSGGTPTPSCGPLPPNVTLTGIGTNTVLVNPPTVDFGFTNCGATATPQTVTITANGQGLNYTTALAKGANTPFSLSTSAGAVPAQGTKTITITPKPIPFPSATSDNGFGDTLTISTDIPGDSPHVVMLNQTARGAILQFAPLTIATHDIANHFSFVSFTIQNVGNYEGTFQLGDGITVVTSINAPAGTWSSNLAKGNLIGGASADGSLTVKGALNTTCGGGGHYLCGTAACTTSRSCADIGGVCGTIDDGCGGVLTCGDTCPVDSGGNPQTCGGGGPNKCGPASCSPSGSCNGKCGPVSDNCGGTIMCAGCPGTQYLGKITLTVQPNPDSLPTILCADAPPDLLLSDENP